MEAPKIPRTKTADQVATRFGVTVGTVYRWRNAGLIKGTRVGHNILFADTEIERYERVRFAGLLDDQVAS